jgi:hypothetical protein
MVCCIFRIGLEPRILGQRRTLNDLHPAFVCGGECSRVQFSVKEKGLCVDVPEAVREIAPAKTGIEWYRDRAARCSQESDGCIEAIGKNGDDPVCSTHAMGTKRGRDPNRLSMKVAIGDRRPICVEQCYSSRTALRLPAHQI